MKKKLFFVSLAVALVSAGITVGIMFALGVVSYGDDDDKGYGNSARYELLTGEIADILGLDEEQVESAIKKAAAQRKHKALQSRLDGMVEKGTLSRDQADAYLDWYKDKPDVPFPDPKLRELKGRQHAKPDKRPFGYEPRTFDLPFGRERFSEGSRPFFNMEPDKRPFGYEPRTFDLPFGREQFREGPFHDGPPPFFGIEPDVLRFRFGQDGEFLPRAEVICEFMGDAFGEWWVEICDDDYYEYFEYNDDDRDDDKDGDGHDNEGRDYD